MMLVRVSMMSEQSLKRVTMCGAPMMQRVCGLVPLMKVSLMQTTYLGTSISSSSSLDASSSLALPYSKSGSSLVSSLVSDDD